MDRIIDIKVFGDHLTKDSKYAGVKGEANITKLRITFDKGWDGYAKEIIFWDAYGENPVRIDLTANLLEDIESDTRIYLVPIPAEPMARAGEMTFEVRGCLDDKKQISISCKLKVKDSQVILDPVAPTPTELQQIQMQVEAIVGHIAEKASAAEESKIAAASSAESAKESEDRALYYADNAGKSANHAEAHAANSSYYALQAQDYASRAKEVVGKTSYIGDNGNWYAWDSSTSAFYDTGVKAQSGSTVYVGDNPPEEADVWIDPNAGPTVMDELQKKVSDIEQDMVKKSSIYNGLDSDDETKVLSANQGKQLKDMVTIVDAKLEELGTVTAKPEIVSKSSLMFRCAQIPAGGTFAIKRGMMGHFYPANSDMSVHTKDGTAFLSNMGAGDFFLEEIGSYIKNDNVYKIEYPFGENAKCTTVSGVEVGLYAEDDVLRLEGGSIGGYLGGVNYGAVANRRVTVKFDLYMSEYDQFRFCPTSYETFSDKKRCGLDITETGQINKLEIANSEWNSIQYTDKPLIFPLKEWHEFTLVYDNVNSTVDVYMDGSRIFGWTGVSMPKGSPKDFSFHGTNKKSTYMNNIKMYVGDANEEANLVCSYLDKPMHAEYRLALRYVSTITYKSHHHIYPEGLYFKNNNSSGNAYVFYIDKEC